MKKYVSIILVTLFFLSFSGTVYGQATGGVGGSGVQLSLNMGDQADGTQDYVTLYNAH